VSSVFGRQSRYLEKRVADRRQVELVGRDARVDVHEQPHPPVVQRHNVFDWIAIKKLDEWQQKHKHAMITVSQWGDSPEREFGFRAPKLVGRDARVDVHEQPHPPVVQRHNVFDWIAIDGASPRS
jgi:hypothetical protein